MLVWLDAGLVHLLLVKWNSCVTIESNESVHEALADAFSLSSYQCFSSRKDKSDVPQGSDASFSTPGATSLYVDGS